MNKKPSGITLMELIISLILLSLIALGIAHLDFFSLAQLISSDRRTKLQNEASFVLEHMTKELKKTIGNYDSVSTNWPVVSKTIPDCSNGIEAQIDFDPDGKWDSSRDRKIAYSLSDGHEVRFYDPYKNFDEDKYEVLSSKIKNFTPVLDWSANNNNYIDVTVTACWSPALAESPDNPCVSMDASISLPSVSSH